MSKSFEEKWGRIAREEKDILEVLRLNEPMILNDVMQHRAQSKMAQIMFHKGITFESLMELAMDPTIQPEPERKRIYVKDQET